MYILKSMPVYRKTIANVERSERRKSERNALSILLQEALGEGVALEHLSDGRPILSSHPETHISISHTEGLVMLALSNKPIGVDVELRCRQTEVAVKRLVSPVLARAMQCLTAALSDKNLIYTIAWTAMEALYKLVPESEVLSDFSYVPKSLCLDLQGRTFSLRARCKKIPDVSLSVHGVIEDNYIYALAAYDEQAL